MNMEFFNSLSEIRLGSVSLSSLLNALLIFVICYVLIRLLCRAFERLLDRDRHMDASLKSFLGSAIKVVLWALAVIIIASSLGIPVTSLVAALSVVGVALSLALQDLLANLFSGMTILATHPFKVGDFVEIGGQAGTVKSIGMFYTGLATVDNRVIYAPNGTVTSGQIINYSAEDKRLVMIDVAVSYDSDAQDVRAAALEAIAAENKALDNPAPLVGISSYGASAVNYTVRVWCRTEDYWELFFSLNENLRAAFIRHGIKLPYDHLNVHILEK